MLRGDKNIPVFGKYTPNQPDLIKQPKPTPEPQWYREISVQQYRGKRRYENGIRKMMSQGWQVISVTEQPPGCFEQFMLGLIFSSTRYTVTYQRDTYQTE